jgi:hypothetical protein
MRALQRFARMLYVSMFVMLLCLQNWGSIVGDAVVTTGHRAWDIVLGANPDDAGFGVRLGIPPAASEGIDPVSATV